MCEAEPGMDERLPSVVSTPQTWPRDSRSCWLLAIAEPKQWVSEGGRCPLMRAVEPGLQGGVSKLMTQ